jgi:hypothetical protein
MFGQGFVADAASVGGDREDSRFLPAFPCPTGGAQVVQDLDLHADAGSVGHDAEICAYSRKIHPKLTAGVEVPVRVPSHGNVNV